MKDAGCEKWEMSRKPSVMGQIYFLFQKAEFQTVNQLDRTGWTQNQAPFLKDIQAEQRVSGVTDV